MTILVPATLRVVVAAAMVTAAMVAAMEAAPAKPRILFLADPVYANSASQTGRILKAQAEVEFFRPAAKEIFNSGMAVVNLEVWLGDDAWDLVVLNTGLSDLVYRAPGMKSFRVLSRSSGGVRAIGPEEYEKNLRELVTRIKATGARLVWVNTLPIDNSPLGIHEPGSEIQYNEIADKVMKEHKIPSVDMHAYGLALLTPREVKGGVSPKTFNKKPLHPPIVTAICNELGITRPPEEEAAGKR